MTKTARLALPLLVPGQLQKEIAHNEAIEAIEMLLHPEVVGPPQATPPASPVEGSCFLIGSGASGDWTGRDGMLAMAAVGGWRFVVPPSGTRAFDPSSGGYWKHVGGSWESDRLRGVLEDYTGSQIVGARGAAVDSPSGGAVVDVEARIAIETIIARLAEHGLIGA
ncbi:DUF2793 domain-containing protein [Sphingomicrobium nitratireducens]|uniref:DUF2793 domain-containing protein n=1 Tax=Sphingomicrobium nitratireducens TaxID=2964666 RepID=UPI00223F364C|nr:DUF2793 domain-containing protein [Sphingomicrobium nitratireducens]